MFRQHERGLSGSPRTALILATAVLLVSSVAAASRSVVSQGEALVDPPTTATDQDVDESPSPVPSPEAPTTTPPPSIPPGDQHSSPAGPDDGTTEGGLVAPSTEPPPNPPPTPDTQADADLIASALIVAVDGRPQAAGTTAHPLDLTTALGEQSPVEPGGTILLRGGVYRGTFLSVLQGAKDAPITVAAYPGEHVTLDGGTSPNATLSIRGHDTTVQGVEVLHSDPRRVSQDAGSHPDDLDGGRGNGVDVFGPRTKLVNLVVHDNGNGIGWWRGAFDSEIYGSIIYNNGWIGPDRGHGHGIYAQNHRGTKRVVDTLVFNNFSHGFQGYDIDRPMAGFELSGLVSFENGNPGGHPKANAHVTVVHAGVDRVSVHDSVLYHRPRTNTQNLRLGPDDSNRFTVLGGKVEVADNLIIGGSNALLLRGWREADVSGNRILARPDGNWNQSLLVDLRYPNAWASTGPLLGAYAWDGNTYHDLNRSSDRVPFRVNGSKHTFSDWVGVTGFDGDTAYGHTSPEQAIVIQANRAERGRAHIAVFRSNRETPTLIDLSRTGLAPGDAFEIRDAEHMSGPAIVAGTYHGDEVELPLGAREVTQPIGDTPIEIQHTPDDFSAYVVLPK